MAPPRIGVIVTAHGRRDFLLGAVESVLHGGSDRDAVEIVVVKNFGDPAIDTRLASEGVANLRTEAGSLGGKLAAAVPLLSAPVVAFLEDDDRFRPGRLERIDQAFKDPELGFWHNGVEVVDRGGRAVPGTYRAETRRNAALAPGERNSAAVRRFLRTSPHFNLSSMAIRRDLLDRALPYLARSNMTCDALVCYAALASPYRLVNEGRPWTEYRLHPSASWGDAPAGEFLDRARERWDEQLAGFATIEEMVDDHPVAKFVRCDLRERRAVWSLAQPAGAGRFGPGELLGLVGCRLLRRDLATGLIAGALALRAVAPELEQRLFARYLRWQTARLGVI